MITFALALHLVAAPAHVVILGGGAAPDAAQPFVAAWPAQAELGLRAADGFPRAHKSAETKGLKPGFHIAIAGFCRDRAQALAVRDLLRLRDPGVYLRKVDVDGPDSCPALVPHATAARVGGKVGPDDAWRQIARVQVDRAAPNVFWRVLGAGATDVTGQGRYYERVQLQVVAGAVPVQVKDLVLASDDAKASPSPKQGPALWRPRLLNIAGRNLARVTLIALDPGGASGTQSLLLYAFVPRAPFVKFAFQTDATAKIGAWDGEDWRTLAVAMNGEGPGAPYGLDEKTAWYAPVPAPPPRAPVHKAGAPVQIVGCGFEHCGCVVNEKLIASVALVKAPRPDAADAGVVPAGTMIERVSFLEVITRTGTAEVLSTGEKVRYVSYAAEGYHNVIDAKGAAQQVHDDDLGITDFGSGPEGWIELSASGRHGYSQDLHALERGVPSAEHGCVR